MKTVSLLIGVFILLNSCTSNQKEFIKELAVIKEINDKVAFENKCKLTTDYTNEKPNEIHLKIGNSYNDLLLPGKVLFDYNKRIELTDLNIKEYHLTDIAGKIYDLSNDDLIRIKHKSKISNSLLTDSKSHDLAKFYNQLDTSVKSQIAFNEFNKQILDFNLNDLIFSGFQLADSIIGIGYKNSVNQIVFFYKWDSEDDKIYGYSLE